MQGIGQGRSTARRLLHGVSKSLLSLAVIAGATTVMVSPAAAATPTLTVDLGTTTGAFRGGASGALYGLYGPDVPTNNLIEGMGLDTTNTKYQDGQQHPGSDALEIAKPFVDSGGGDIMIYMTDVYRAAYERASYTAFKATMKTQVEQAMASPYASHIVFVPYNEPDLNWFSAMTSNSSQLAAFNAEWKQTYDFIKGIWPAARLAGPNVSGYSSSAFSGFLSYCKTNSCLPDVVTWHTLINPKDVRTTVEDYRAREIAAGVSPITVNLNEYAHRFHLTDPGQMVQWIAAVEDEKVDGNLPYWNINGNLGDSAAAQNTPNAQWWLYNWYSSMSGNTVKVTGAANNDAYTLQGLASLDTAKKQARVILAGGGTSGDSNTVIKNISSSVFGSTVHVSVFQDRYSGYIGAASAPVRLSDADVTVGSDGSITLPITLDAMSAYQVILSPGGTGSATASDNTWTGSYEAEDATLTGSATGINTEGSATGDVGKFATSGGKNVGGLRTGSDSVISFAVSVPTTGDYDLSVFGNSYGKDSDVRGPTNIYARVDGGASSRIDVPVGFQWVVWGHSEATVHLTAGSHTITLATTGDNGAATVGDAIIDKIDLKYKDASVQGTTVIEAEQANLSDNSTASYTSQGQSGAGAVNLTSGKSATFWVYSARDGYADLATRFRNTGQADLTVNGKTLNDQTLSGATPDAWTTSTNRVYLNSGINKVKVTGTSGTLALDRLAVTPFSATDTITTGNVVTYQAENGTLTGTAAADTTYTQAKGTGVVTGIGNGTANSLTLNVNAPTAGTYAMTMRYSNAEELPSNHYNPDLYAEHADVSVNGGTATRVNFASTLHWNQFNNYTVPVTLAAGANTVKFTASQLYNYDGTTIGLVYSGGGSDIGQPMRSSSAPHLDQVSFAPQNLHIGASTGFSSTAVAQHSVLCLENPGQSTADGTQLQQNTCGTGQEQRFDFHPVSGATDTYTVVNHSSGKCLDISAFSTANGGAVQQWTCHGGTNQRFTLNAVTALGNSHDYQLVAVNSGKCVDVSGISTATGAKVH
ncbi:RICIN domain-containing protein, partial [Streptomyces geranii]|uniref:RICIN domain-containing protein n=1 Tax=Streptomyces geranii TaxID=2058923 RepID=UPI000D026C8C